MKIELRNVKYAAFASQETSCFEASIYIDGIIAGYVSNEGNGGSNRYGGSGGPFDVEARLNEHARTLPATEEVIRPELPEGHPDRTWIVVPDADSIIGDLLMNYLDLRDLKRKTKNRILYTRTDKPGIYQTAVLPPVTKAVTLDALMYPGPTKTKWNADKILNLLPEAEAVVLFREQSRAAA